MRRVVSALTSVIFLAILLTSVSVAAEGGLLKGIDKEVKKKKGPSLGYLLRDDLKNQFKKIMTAYLAEDQEAYLAFFADDLMMASRTLYRKPAKTNKAELKKRIENEFKQQDFTKVEFDEAFDMAAPTMLFVLTEEQLHDDIPVWGFSVEPKEVAKYMKPGDFLVIANVLPGVYDKVSMPGTVYIIFRKIEGKLVAVGLD